MANLKEVRERISSVKNTQQITKAMKMVSAAKLRRAQQAIQDMRPYSNKLNEMLRNILSNLDGNVTSSFGEERPIESACIVVVTSNRGLCGGFNSSIVKETLTLVDTKYKEVRAKGNLTILFVGKKGYDGLKKVLADCTLNTDHLLLFDDLAFDNVSKVGRALMTAFEDKTYDAVDTVYGHFKNAATQFPLVEQFLPVAKIEATGDDESKQLKADYIFEPSKEGLLEYLIPSILQTQFQKFMLDTHASEHGARMTAMDKATENAAELLKELKISYNKARQEAITNEILEIVGGAAALESDK